MTAPAAKLRDGDRVYYQSIDTDHRTGRMWFGDGNRGDRGTAKRSRCGGLVIVWDTGEVDDVDESTGQLISMDGFARRFRPRAGDQYEPMIRPEAVGWL